MFDAEFDHDLGLGLRFLALAVQPDFVVDMQLPASRDEMDASAAPGSERGRMLHSGEPAIEVGLQPAALVLADKDDIEIAVAGIGIVRQI